MVQGNLRKIAEGAKNHGVFVLLIILLVFVNLYSFDVFSLSTLPMLDHSTTYLPRMEFMRQSFYDYGDSWPLWNPYGFSGMPMLGSGLFLGLDSWSGWLAILFPAVAATKLNYLLDFVIAGISMYALVFSVTRKRAAGLLGAIVYMFSGYMIRTLDGGLTQLNAYAITPLIFLFAIKAFREKEWVFYSVLTGIMFALQIRVDPSLKVPLFNILAFGIFLAVQLVGSEFNGRAKKVFYAGIIVSVVVLGLSAQRVLPTKEYLDITGRGHLSYEQSASRVTPLSETFSTAIEPLKLEIRYSGREGFYKIGIIAFLLILYALYKKPTKRIHIFLMLTMILALSITSGSFVFRLLYDYVPPFDSFRYLERVFALFSFAGAFLAALGADMLLDSLKEKYRLERKGMIIACSALIGLVVLNLMVFARQPAGFEQYPVQEVIENNDILRYIANQTGSFRIHTFETNGIDWGTDLYNVPLRLEHIYAYSSTWLTEYMNEYLAIGMQYNPAVFWGILNVRYVTSMEERNLTGLSLVQKFDECRICPIKNLLKAHGPYLYENNEFVPRAFITKNAILVAGSREDVKNVMYGLMLKEQFDPKNMAIIFSERKINSYDIDGLKKFPVIALAAGSVDEGSMGLLKAYVDSGGILLPDITKGEKMISDEGLARVWEIFKSRPAKSIEGITAPNLERKDVKTGGKSGFLVMSELYSMYPGWSASADGGESEIMRANGVISAVYLEEPAENVEFRYLPRSYMMGSWISVITVILILGYLVYYFKKSKNVQTN
ncbi:hypothetical protein HY638_02795 [Candidatus Woesearchaeota archaeon]|nr:hypothetical protein [Candidatus Woesearchaeota archaeon]